MSGAGVATGSAVVAGTLLGLAAGAFLGGRLADRSGKAGLVFAGCEAAGAALSVLVALFARFLGGEGAGFAGSLPQVGRLALACVACAVPCLLLGASLPAALRALDPAQGRAGPLLGRLYAVNTIGAVVGILGATGYGFEALGVQGVVLAAAGLQVVVGLAGAALFARAETVRSAGTSAPAVAAQGVAAPRAIVLAAFLSGAAGLAVEIAWIRRLTPALGTTTYAFGTVLAAFLLAVALGSALLAPRRTTPAGSRPALVLALAALPAAGLAFAVGPAAKWAAAALSEAMAHGDAGAGTLLRIRATAAVAVLVPAATLGAAALPWLLHALDPRTETSGRAAGRVLAANTIGSAIAAVLAGVVLVPLVGTAGTLRAAGALYLAAAAAVATGKARPVLAVLAVATAVLAATPLPDESGRDAVGATFDPDSTDPAAAPAVFFAEGRVSTVVVRDRDGRPELWVDGKVVASASPTDRLHLALLGHLPMLLHPDPRRVAVVGLGTGITSGAVSLHRPEVLDVFELEAEVAPAAESFRAFGGGLPAGAHLHVEDGRQGLLRSGGLYDVITSDPIHPAASGSAELYTTEHYRVLASRLAPGGLVCQWLPLYEISVDDLRMVLRTFSQVFDVSVFVAGPDLVMIGIPRGAGPRLDVAGLKRRLLGPAAEPLRRLGLADASRLLGLLVADPRRSRTFAGEGPLNTDDRPLLEFSSARSQYTGSSVENLQLLSIGIPDPASVVAGGLPEGAGVKEGLDRSRRLRKATGLWMRGEVDAWAEALPVLETLALEDPQDTVAASLRDEALAFLAFDAARRGDREEAVEKANAVLATPAAEDRSRLRAAEALAEAGESQAARRVGEDVLRRHPTSTRARRLAALP